MARSSALLLVCVSFLFFTLALGALDTDVLRQWKDFKVRFGKTYQSPAEEKKRFHTFVENLGQLDAWQKISQSSSAQYGITKFFVRMPLTNRVYLNLVPNNKGFVAARIRTAIPSSNGYVG